jgi:tRNA-Thr(GGU) m(6)t(6)A37 methyltransferase TsaA
MKINFSPIGFLRTPFTSLLDMPIQPSSDKAQSGYVDIFPEYEEALKDIGLFSHVILLYYFHAQSKTRLTVKPFLDDVEHGVFATRAPARPNPIGMSVVELVKLEKNRLFLNKLDMLDGTPLLDIKPYVPQFDCYENANSGWLPKRK